MHARARNAAAHVHAEWRERERERSGGATCARIGTYEFCGGWMVTWLNLLLENLNLCVGFFFLKVVAFFYYYYYGSENN